IDGLVDGTPLPSYSLRGFVVDVLEGVVLQRDLPGRHHHRDQTATVAVAAHAAAGDVARGVNAPFATSPKSQSKRWPRSDRTPRVPTAVVSLALELQLPGNQPLSLLPLPTTT